MKLRVCKEFTDKYTGEIYPVGSEIEVTEERGAELLGHPLNLVETVEEPAPQKSAPAPKKKRGAAK